jgi:hypothetical protein
MNSIYLMLCSESCQVSHEEEIIEKLDVCGLLVMMELWTILQC